MEKNALLQLNLADALQNVAKVDVRAQVQQFVRETAPIVERYASQLAEHSCYAGSAVFRKD